MRSLANGERMTLATMMDWFAAESDLVERECEDCGCVIYVRKNQLKIHRWCRECSDIHKLDKIAEQTEALCTGDPAIDIVAAVINQAAEDAKNGSAEARSFLRSEDGAALYLRAIGVDITDDISRKLYWIGKERNARVKARLQ